MGGVSCTSVLYRFLQILSEDCHLFSRLHNTVVPEPGLRCRKPWYSSSYTELIDENSCCKLQPVWVIERIPTVVPERNISVSKFFLNSGASRNDCSFLHLVNTCYLSHPASFTYSHKEI